MTNSSTLLFGSLILTLAQVCASFYAPLMPNSYQRYMDDRSFLRPGAPLPIASFLPAPSFVFVEEAPGPIQPLPTPLPLRQNPQFVPQAVPRRAVRQFAGETHQFKRMRPCFYSPIQCLMKRSVTGNEDEPTGTVEKSRPAESVQEAATASEE